MEEEITFERLKTRKSVNVAIYFNSEFDQGEIEDFLDRALHKYQHPDDVVKEYEYWFDD